MNAKGQIDDRTTPAAPVGVDALDKPPPPTTTDLEDVSMVTSSPSFVEPPPFYINFFAQIQSPDENIKQVSGTLKHSGAVKILWELAEDSNDATTRYTIQTIRSSVYPQPSERWNFLQLGHRRRSFRATVGSTGQGETGAAEVTSAVVGDGREHEGGLFEAAVYEEKLDLEILDVIRFGMKSHWVEHFSMESSAALVLQSDAKALPKDGISFSVCFLLFSFEFSFIFFFFGVLVEGLQFLTREQSLCRGLVPIWDKLIVYEWCLVSAYLLGLPLGTFVSTRFPPSGYQSNPLYHSRRPTAAHPPHRTSLQWNIPRPRTCQILNIRSFDLAQHVPLLCLRCCCCCRWQWQLSICSKPTRIHGTRQQDTEAHLNAHRESVTRRNVVHKSEGGHDRVRRCPG